MIALNSRNRFTPTNIGFELFRISLLPFLPVAQSSCPIPPVVIGAMGGSGTRVLPKILRLADFWMGAWINPQTQDAMATRHFLQHHFSSLVSHHATNHNELIREFSRLIAAHRWGIPQPDERWGWKNPRNMWIIPFLSRVYPELKFIHLVRDGRDMALSGNTNLLRKHGAFLLDDPDCMRNREASQLKLWVLGNRMAQEDGRKYLGSNYLLLNYENLCSQPKESLIRLFDFLEISIPGETIDSACQLIVPSRNIGRWRKTDLTLLQSPDEEVRDALQRCGYDVGDYYVDATPASEPVSCMG